MSISNWFFTQIKKQREEQKIKSRTGLAVVVEEIKKSLQQLKASQSKFQMEKAESEQALAEYNKEMAQTDIRLQALGEAVESFNDICKFLSCLKSQPLLGSFSERPLPSLSSFRLLPKLRHQLIPINSSIKNNLLLLSYENSLVVQCGEIGRWSLVANWVCYPFTAMFLCSNLT